MSLHRSPTSFTCLSSPLRFDPHAIHASRFPLADRSADGSLSPPLSPFPRDCTLHHCTVGPLASVSSSFLGDTELEPKSGAPTDRAFLRGPLPPTRFIARRPDAARRAERGRVTVSRADFSLEPSRSRRGNLCLLFNLGRRVILRNCVE